MDQKVLKIKINSTTVAVILDDFLILNQNGNDLKEINQDYLQRIIKEKNINLIITTRTKEELNFIKNLCIIKINQNDDYETIDNANIQIQKYKGNFLYLFDNYKLMLKYIICLKLANNYTSNTQNLDYETQSIIEGFELRSFFDSYKSYLSSGSTQIISVIQMSQEKYNLPKPIQIQQFIVNMDQKLMN